MKNMGLGDRIFRILIGFGMLGYIVFATGPLRWILLLGIIPLATAAVGFCPFYRLVGLDTLHRRAS